LPRVEMAALQIRVTSHAPQRIMSRAGHYVQEHYV
jgi:hypothetical protein